MLDVDGALARLQRGDMGRGPMTGMGRSHGRPFTALVEDVPQLWVTWVVGLARLTGKPVPTAIVVGGVRVAITSVRLTFGDRFYFQCPRCTRRHEVLYILGKAPMCRRCGHLGYQSQARRTSSIGVLFDALLGRYRLPGRYDVNVRMLGNLLDGARDDLAARLTAALEGVTVEVQSDREELGA